MKNELLDLDHTETMVGEAVPLFKQSPAAIPE